MNHSLEKKTLVLPIALLVAICLLLSCSQPAPCVVNVPEWSKGAVWYQIFPERFRNGDPANDPTSEDAGIANYANWQTSPWTSDWYALHGLCERRVASKGSVA